ncbi:sce7726 family protein [Rhizobium rhizogenes]|jgi:hypothetical protein|uniref:sce7726 family protein n=1 Tax=Rhizobium rhizogenes TaxID=359 RepID=UPI0015731C90|nr:sce7726 family protein [Rhizobium rhizogenes]NTI33101.1 sce7726 family protein [Rhizobium rhizogenes]WEO64811.1 sce7726 family protein [Rhizobium rhizogenes]
MRDIHIRTAMLDKLRHTHRRESDVRIVQEMGVWAGTVRVDIAVLNGEMVGYELKSDSDTLMRLPTQADIYSRVFDRMTLVAGSRHFDKAIEIVPSWWGLIKAIDHGGGIKLQQARPSRRNQTQEPYLIAELLRKDEALLLMERLGIARGWRSKRVKAIHEYLAYQLPLRVLRNNVRDILKARVEWLGQDCMHEFDMSVNTKLNPVF